VTDSAATRAVGRISQLCDLGRWQEAAGEAGLYLQSSPGEGRVLCLLAQARLGLDDPAGALAAAQAAMLAEPSSEWALRLASLACRRLGRTAEAVDLARAAVAASPFLAETHVALARAELELGRNLGGARSAAEHAVGLAPHMVDAHLAVSAIAYAQGRFMDAEASCREALRIDPQSAVAHNQFARIYLRYGGLTPSALATAAGGFASALRADPRIHVSRANLDLTMRAFLRRLTLLVFLAAAVGGKIATAYGMPRGALWVPVGALAVPAAFVLQFVLRLNASLRNHLAWRLRGWEFALPAAALAVACVLLVLGALVPGMSRTTLAAAMWLPVGAGLVLIRGQ
jgi:tetratricopeptide (TPR) repeat protein